MSDKGPKHTPITPEAEIVWSHSLGYFIWSMGQIEWQTYEWGQRIGGYPLKDLLISQAGFGRRHSVLTKAIQETNWSEPKKEAALLLWRHALGFSRFRNIIAHSPVVEHRRHPGTFCIVDARTLKGSEGRFHRVYFAPIVYHSAERMQSLAARLMSFEATQ